MPIILTGVPTITIHKEIYRPFSYSNCRTRLFNDDVSLALPLSVPSSGRAASGGPHLRSERRVGVVLQGQFYFSLIRGIGVYLDFDELLGVVVLRHGAGAQECQESRRRSRSGASCGTARDARAGEDSGEDVLTE